MKIGQKYVIIRLFNMNRIVLIGQKDNNIGYDDRRRKTDEAQHFMEDRTQLLDTIREMINVEIDRRGGCIEGETMHSKMPPEPHIRKRSFLEWLRSLI